jgi:acyl-CoA synthetase (AMP-forming)/AMP-acid ligase II
MTGRAASEKASAEGDPTIVALIRRIASQFAETEAIVLEADRLSYAALGSQSSAMARALMSHGLTKGARIGIWLGNGPDWVVAWAAVCRSGGIAVPLSTMYTPHELARAARIADLQGLIVHERYRGRDAVATLEQAFPELSAADSGPLSIVAAPYLRWIATTGTEQPTPWMHTREWLFAARSAFSAEVLDAAEREVHAGDPCMILFTSGTTAEPKAILHTHDSVMSQLAAVTEALRFAAGTRAYTPMPFFWLAGQLHGLFPVLIVGGTVVCAPDFTPARVLRLLSAERIDRLYMTKSQADQLINSDGFAASDRSHLKIGFPVELLPPGTPLAASARLTSDGLYMGLGMSETYGPYWFGQPPFERSVDAAELYPDVPPLTYVAPGFAVKVVDSDGRVVTDSGSGEICVRGRGVMAGMCKRTRQSTFDDDGFYRTGDRGRVAAGTVYFQGRLNDVIKTAGATVSPEEVERELLRAPGVAMAVVVGIPDPIRGHDVAAAVVLKPGTTLVSDDLRTLLSARLSSFMVPRHIVVFDQADIPMTASQRVRRSEVARLIAESRKS